MISCSNSSCVSFHFFSSKLIAFEKKIRRWGSRPPLTDTELLWQAPIKEISHYCYFYKGRGGGYKTLIAGLLFWVRETWLLPPSSSSHRMIRKWQVYHIGVCVWFQVSYQTDTWYLQGGGNGHFFYFFLFFGTRGMKLLLLFLLGCSPFLSFMCPKIFKSPICLHFDDGSSIFGNNEKRCLFDTAVHSHLLFKNIFFYIFMFLKKSTWYAWFSGSFQNGNKSASPSPIRTCGINIQVWIFKASPTKDIFLSFISFSLSFWVAYDKLKAHLE